MRKIARLAVLAMLMTTLAACHTTPVVWSKPGADQAQLESDLQACAEQAKAVAPLPYDIRTMSTTSEVQETTRRQVSCMLGRGWKLTPLPSQ